MFLKKVEEKEMDRMEKITRGASLNKFKPGVCQLWPRKKAAGQDLRNLEHAYSHRLLSGVGRGEPDAIVRPKSQVRPIEGQN